VDLGILWELDLVPGANPMAATVASDVEFFDLGMTQQVQAS